MKRNYNYLKIVALALAVTFSASSCKEALEVNPVDSIDSESALASNEGIQASITSIYATLKGENFYGNRLVGLGEALADNGRSTNKSGRYVNEASNVRGNHYSHWSGAYNALNRINLTLEAIPGLNVPGLTQAQKDLYIGELKFLRALYHFDLVKAYAYIPGAEVASQNKGGIPLALKAVKTAGEAISFTSERAPIADVYTAIYADLDDAVAKLGNMGASPARANKQAAQALYSRVALYRKDWAKSTAMASDVITARGNTLTTPSNYVASWTGANNPESLFEVVYATNGETLGVNVSLQTLFTTLVTRGDKTKGAGFGDLVPTSDLLNALGITVTGNGTNAAAITARSVDVRNQLFELGASTRGAPYVESTKFIGKNGAVNVDNVPVLRIAEMYLNRAEAYANSNQPDLALADVNRIRTARGLTPILVLTGNALLEEIALQRRLEFAFEGHRFLDLKRRGQDIFKPVTNTVVAFTETVILPGIPQGDVDASKGKLAQNPGY